MGEESSSVAPPDKNTASHVVTVAALPGPQSPPDVPDKETFIKRHNVIFFILKVLCVFVIMWLVFWKCQKQFFVMLAAFEGMKPAWKGPVLYILLIAAWMILMLPQAIVVLGSGAIWGLYKGALIGLVGKTLGSMLAFFISRRWGSSLVSSRLKDPKAAALLRALNVLVTERPHFFTFLVCASLIPAFIKFYGLGTLAAVPWWSYLLFGILWSIPFCLIFSFVGSSAADLGSALKSSSTNGPPVVKLATLVALIFTLLLVLFFGWYTRKVLYKHVAVAQEKLGEEDKLKGEENEKEKEIKVIEGNRSK